ncbi:uncharacterized protein LOC127750268 [Frankliniella occidentalis]|uniref:Uncharacterized protein LOC127750268 n=1 Tax=Frankliniella occidentalis TaxID=133901 RepID=A0A9C6XQD9_FRAOC|nr:uncharacterized protein LOC127750268 [Frankliniella occidentalis]
MKEGMAKSFCVVFPKFANTDDKERPWSPVFSPLGPSGYIANASRSFMRENPQRPTRAKKRKTTEKDCEWDDDDIRILGLINPGKSEKSEILDGMAKCFEVRNAERLRRESITFFMLKYPQFNKYEGEVVSI